MSVVAAPAVNAVAAGAESGASLDPATFTLVFSDDFTTNPNTNGLWTIHRYDRDSTTQAVWDKAAHAWHLTLPANNKGVAVFANYELTATTWKAEFDYRAAKLGGLQNGGDGFVFMFYKNKGAYGTPAFGASMGFQLSNGAPVAGYGMKFDNYIEGCDPASRDFVALIQDDMCTVLAVQQGDWADGNVFHKAQVLYTEGSLTVAVDGYTILNYELTDPDYSFSGVGFGAGTGSAVGDYEIRGFQLWVAE
jgi:hypothetical protein